MGGHHIVRSRYAVRHKLGSGGRTSLPCIVPGLYQLVLSVNLPADDMETVLIVQPGGLRAVPRLCHEQETAHVNAAGGGRYVVDVVVVVVVVVCCWFAVS